MTLWGINLLQVKTLQHKLFPATEETFISNLSFEPGSSFPEDNCFKEFLKIFHKWVSRTSSEFDHHCSPTWLTEDGVPVYESFLVSPVCVLAQNYVLNVFQNNLEELMESNSRKVLQLHIHCVL